MMFFTFSTLYTNKALMQLKSTNSMITGNIIAPSLGVAIFSVFFVIYAQSSFVKFRKTEFGLFMVLGMNDHDIQKIMLIENSIIAIASLLIGLISGTIFSRIFYMIILSIININGIDYSFNYESYLYTVLFFIGLYVLVIIGSLIDSLRYNIIYLLKSNRKKDTNLFSGTIWVAIGIILIIITIIDIKFNYNVNNPNILIRSMIICLCGIFVLISNSDWLISKVFIVFRDKKLKNTLIISNLKYTLGQTKKILFTITILISMSVLFSSFAADFIFISQKYATLYNPYHIAYADVFGKNGITFGELNGILKKSETPLTSIKTLYFMKDQRMTIFSDKNLNENLGTHISVKKGYFLSFFQIVINDGYAHNTNGLNKFDINVAGKNLTFLSQGSIKEVLFNSLPILDVDPQVVLNNNDYQNLKKYESPYNTGNIKLLNFRDWRKTGKVFSLIKNDLEKYNLNSKPIYSEENDKIIFSPISRLGEYNNRYRASAFLLFMLSFVGLLFFISSSSILHFKLQTELENEKVKYKKLVKIGITENEIFKLISKELIILFFLPFVLSSALAIFYFNTLTNISMGGSDILCPFVFSILYLLYQIIFYIIYRHFYTRKLINSCINI